jgi:regulator of sirC expression with transglutaminase-like and TPR domain
VAARDELLARFRALAARGEPDLFEGALAVAELVHPAEDLEAARRSAASLAERVRRGAGGEEPAHAALRRVLFAEEGFRGDDQDYDSPENSSVARVLARRRGMPITLSIVTLEVGRLAGLRLAGVGLPGHFVVGGPDLPEGMFLDPFDGGALYEPSGLSRRLGAIFGSPVALSSDLLRPDPSRAILARVLLNLRRSYERRQRWEEALSALDFAETLQPAEAAHLRERGLLLFKCGRTEEAVEALERYAESVEGDGEETETVERLLAAVRGGGGDESADREAPRRTFTLEEARALLPRVRELTAEAVSQYSRLPGEQEKERETIVRAWAEEIQSLGIEVKGIWLVDFDSGAGYYCWKYPEAALDHFHGYEEGFAGRLPLT